MAITDRIYLENHRQFASQLDVRIPRGAFAGATLDLLFQGENLAALDDASRERVLAFATDFLDCSCAANPHCGHPERKFVRYLLDLRRGGLSPEAMVDVMGDDYGLTAYPGDVVSFLDDAVRAVEAMERLADVEGCESVADRAREHRRQLTG